MSNIKLAFEIVDNYYLKNHTERIENEKVREIYGKYKSKKEILEKALKTCGKPKDPITRYFWACYFKSDKINRKQEIEYKRNYVNNELYENYILYQKKCHQKKDPLYTYEQAKGSHLAYFYAEISKLEYSEKMYVEALEDIDKAIELNPNFFFYYEDKIKMMLRMKKIDEAIAFLEKVKEEHNYFSLNVDMKLISKEMDKGKEMDRERVKSLFGIFNFTCIIDRLLKECIDKRDKFDTKRQISQK